MRLIASPLLPALLVSRFTCFPFSSGSSLQAFAWWTDLMVEHAENFLALYAIDMDAALEIQSPESWDSFPLFQLLNDFLRTDCKIYFEREREASFGNV